MSIGSVPGAANLCQALLASMLLLGGCQASPDSATHIEVRNYTAHVIKKIEIIGAQRYPELPQLITHATKIRLALHIAHSGKLLEVELLRASSIPQLDQLMLELIEYAAPYPPMPDTVRQKVLRIEHEWRFVTAD